MGIALPIESMNCKMAVFAKPQFYGLGGVMSDRVQVCAHELHDFLSCDYDSGVLYWKHRSDCGPRWNGRYANKRAFTYKEASGYMTGRIHRSAYKAHRIIWAMANGAWPENEIDHINGDRSDNRLSNLRCVTSTENKKNMRLRSDNTSGHHGVVWHKGAGKWMVRVESVYLGVFSDIEDAIKARSQADVQYGFHRNHGRKS